MSRNHAIAAQISRGGPATTVDEIYGYTVANNMQSVADEFSLELRVRKSLWQLVQPDSLVEIWIDDSQVLSGFIDSRSKDGDRIEVTGRDRGGRLVDERAPLLSYSKRTLQDLFFQLASPWFERVTLSNAANRALIGGRGRKRNTAGPEPVYIAGSREMRKEVNPGERIADVLLELAEQAGVLFWSTADGKELFVGTPNQNQQATWWFLASPAGTAAHLSSDVRDMVWTDDLAEYFSEITVCGAGKASSTQRRAVSADGPLPGGLGNRFAFTKRDLIVDNDIRSAGEAKERANRERAELAAHIRSVSVTVGGHGQVVTSAQVPAIFHVDSVAHCEDTEIGEADDFFVTAVTFNGTADDDSTTLECVPVGTELRVHG